MLISFTANNYKSFIPGFQLCLEPAPHISELSHSVMAGDAGEDHYEALPTAVLYGPTGAGKSTVLDAMDTFKRIVLAGNIEAPVLSTIPNIHKHDDLVKLGISFTHRGLLVEYSVEMKLGDFLEEGYRRRITEEDLTINQTIIFQRSDNSLEMGDLWDLQDYLNGPSDLSDDTLFHIAENSLSRMELFLMNGFKSIFSKNLAMLIREWFEKYLIVFPRPIPGILTGPAELPEDTLHDIARSLGLSNSKLAYHMEGNGRKILCSDVNSNGRKEGVPAERFESAGTMRFLAHFPFVMKALENGGVLAVDEFDAMQDPMAISNIVEAFHDDAINIHHAQLIFTTHNPIYMNSDIFRPDEINFVDYEPETHDSYMSDLSEHVTEKARKIWECDYMRNYLSGYYGATRNPDFSKILAGAAMDGLLQ